MHHSRTAIAFTLFVCGLMLAVTIIGGAFWIRHLAFNGERKDVQLALITITITGSLLLGVYRRVLLPMFRSG